MEIARTGVGSRKRRSYGDAIFIIKVTGSALYGISASSKVSFRVSKHFGQPNEYEKTYSRWRHKILEIGGPLCWYNQRIFCNWLSYNMQS